jgi:hypothetical protein
MEEAYDSHPKARLWDGEYSDSETEEMELSKDRKQNIDFAEPSLASK